MKLIRLLKSIQPPPTVWNFIIDIESWWVKSNPEHVSLVIDNAEKNIGIGTKITL